MSKPSKPRLIYFDAPVSRGEECRLALHVAGVDFEDVRVKAADWPAMKPTTPFGSMPVYEVEGQAPLGQSNAILALIGRQHGLHPTDLYEAARHEAMMAHVEDLRHVVGPTLRMDADAKKAAREAMVATNIPAWATHAEKQMGDGPFFAGAKLHVVDVKIFAVLRWFNGGKVDHVPATVFDAFPKLVRCHDAVRDHAKIKEWYAKL